MTLIEWTGGGPLDGRTFEVEDHRLLRADGSRVLTVEYIPPFNLRAALDTGYVPVAQVDIPIETRDGKHYAAYPPEIYAMTHFEGGA
jgi:hypothetical protein